jgi:hypothetical protein
MAKKNTRSYGMLEKCAECQGYWLDGHKDCQITTCGLYPWMPYRKLEPDWGWSDYSAKRTGRVTWDEAKSDMSPEQEEAAKERGRQLAASGREAMAEDNVGIPAGGFQPQVPTPPGTYVDPADEPGTVGPEDYDNDPIWG